MAIPSIQDMLDAGVHFGHESRRWNPKMKRYILTERNGIYIIDLAKTQIALEKAIGALQRAYGAGRNVLFVGTKKTIKDCLKEEAKRCGQFYVTERWLGGMLTNFSTIKQSVKQLEEIERMENEGLFAEITKKEVLTLNRERAKLEMVLGGIRNMRTLPGVLIVVDAKHEAIAVHEANRLEIPVISLVDTNSDPTDVSFPIPANDDSLRSVGMILRALTESIMGIKPNAMTEAPGAKKPELVAASTAIV